MFLIFSKIEEIVFLIGIWNVKMVMKKLMVKVRNVDRMFFILKIVKVKRKKRIGVSVISVFIYLFLNGLYNCFYIDN